MGAQFCAVCGKTHGSPACRRQSVEPAKRAEALAAVTKNAAVTIIQNPVVTKNKRGRPPKPEGAKSAAERQRLSRARKAGN